MNMQRWTPIEPSYSFRRCSSLGLIAKADEYAAWTARSELMFLRLRERAGLARAALEKIRESLLLHVQTPQLPISCDILSLCLVHALSSSLVPFFLVLPFETYSEMFFWQMFLGKENQIQMLLQWLLPTCRNADQSDLS